MKILAIRGRNLASLYGDFDLPLDAGPIAESGLFSISGPTGSGKSTLVDALCLALFGDTPRYDSRGGGVKPGRADQDEADLVDANDRRNLLSRGTGDGFAEVDFEGVDGKRYRAKWEVRRARGKPDGRFQNVQATLRELDGPEAWSGVAEVRKRVAERLGYTFEEFRRAVVLPQFEFRAFLDADPNTRANILERVTGTEIYSRISAKAHEKARDAADALKALREQAGAVAPLPPEERAALEARVGAAAAARDAADAAAKAAEADVRWLEAEEALKREVAEGAAAAERARQASAAADGRRAHLAEVERAEPLRGTLADAERTRRDEAQAGQARDEAAQTAADAAVAHDAALHARERAKGALAATLADSESLRPALEQARALDVRIGEASERAGDADRALDAARTAEADHRTNLSALERRIADATARRTDAEAWIAERGAQRSLACDWTRWKERLAAHAALVRDLDAALRTEEAARGAADVRARDRAAKSAALDEAQAAFSVLETTAAAAMAAAASDDLAALAARVKDLGIRRDRLVALRAASDEAAAAAAEWNRARAAEHAAREALAAFDREQRQLHDDTSRAEGKLLGAREALVHLEAALTLEDRRAALVDGEPCPLCGSVEHPYATHAPERSALQVQRDAVKSAEAAVEALRREGERLTADVAAESRSAERAAEDASRFAVALETARDRYASAQAVASASDAPADPMVAGPEVERLVSAAEADILAAQDSQAAALARSRAADDARRGLDAARVHVEEARRALAAAELDLERATSDVRRAQEHVSGLRTRFEGSEADLDPALGFRARWRDEARAHPEALARDCAAIVAAHGERDRALAGAIADLADAEPRRAAARAALDAAASTASAAHEAAERARELLRALQVERRGLLAGRPVSEVESARAAAERDARRALEAAEAALTSAAAKQGAVEERRSATAQAAAAASERAAAATQALATALSAASLARARLESLLARGPEWVSRERNDLVVLLRAVAEAQATETERKRKLEAHAAAGRPPTTLEEARPRATAAAAALKETSEAHNNAQVELRADDLRAKEHARLGEALALAEAEAHRWGQLGELIGSHDGQKLRVFAQGVTLDALLAASNVHLAALSPRYRLQRVPRRDLDLQVVDGDLANEIRGVNGLSGGESFLVSLALALGLASLSTRRTQARTLFIDEGFGTLDRDTLEQAMTAVDRLRSGNRIVGVISHVPELHERIGVKVTIERVGAGRSRLVLPEGTAPGAAAAETLRAG
jgi:exonuclease SbcC